MNEVEQAFEALFFGAGCWLGILLYLVVIGLACARVRYLGLLGIPISILLAIEYMGRATAENNLAWCAIIMFLSVPFLLFSVFRKGSSSF